MAANKRETMAQLVLLTAEREQLRRFVLSKPVRADLPKKVSGRLSVKRGRKILFFEESYPGGRVRQFALSTDEIVPTLPGMMENYLQADLATPVGDAVLLRSKKGTETLRGEANLRRALDENGAPLFSTVTQLDREPKRILTGSEPFLFALGVSDENGRVHDKRQPKFRQINRFLELVSDICAELPTGDAPLLVYDLCCGKSYLSFALYHYLTAVKGRRVEMLCVDLKADVIDFCRGVARDAGFLAGEDGCGMIFRAMDIRLIPRDRRPDLVVSLHACDVATDVVLDAAAALKAKVILSTPCCHRYLDRKIKSPELAFVVRHPKLRGKLAEALTDALRCLRLEAAGYEVTAAELVDPDDTPKNTVIRAILREDPNKMKTAAANYEAAKKFVLEGGADAYLTDI
ncbi:MAG: SAM-dependent methyltransferase [Clostridia bacterium]|nr:SAM-dependent methyltransferase [Clostridia bacterium]